jgi:hypothetical protein
MRKEWTQVIILLIFVFSSIASGSEPLSSVKISIPDYKVNKVANLDYVEIPEGEILLAEEGRPRVPYYTQSIDYPDGYRVQDVILKKKAGLRTATGLKLPVVILNPQLKSYPKMKEGWYPEEEYEWKVWDNPDGSATLVMMVVLLWLLLYILSTTILKLQMLSSTRITSLTSNTLSPVFQ